MPITNKLSEVFKNTEIDSKGFPQNLLSLLQESKSVSNETGWSPIHFYNSTNLLASYIKSHSYGDYIFDWAWADLYTRMGIEYYPKLVHSLPFSPINAAKMIPCLNEDLINESINFYKNAPVNSHHYLFIDQEISSSLEKKGYKIQRTIQYHFKNTFKSFEDYLDSLKARKRKQVRNELKNVSQYEIEFEFVSGEELTNEQTLICYNLYLSTIAKKGAIPYLTKDFFENIPKFLGDSFKVLFAKKDGLIIAMSIFFLNDMTLYGRYWGIDPMFDSMPMLHFYMCYYFGIEYTIENNLEVFEAGAQGEQKLLRGFYPVEILSAHHLKNDYARKIIFDHIDQQNEATLNSIDELKSYLPYKL